MLRKAHRGRGLARLLEAGRGLGRAREKPRPRFDKIRERLLQQLLRHEIEPEVFRAPLVEQPAEEGQGEHSGRCPLRPGAAGGEVRLLHPSDARVPDPAPAVGKPEQVPVRRRLRRQPAAAGLQPERTSRDPGRVVGFRSSVIAVLHRSQDGVTLGLCKRYRSLSDAVEA